LSKGGNVSPPFDRPFPAEGRQGRGEGFYDGSFKELDDISFLIIIEKGWASSNSATPNLTG
jgi:hypothetical protein